MGKYQIILILLSLLMGLMRFPDTAFYFSLNMHLYFSNLNTTVFISFLHVDLGKIPNIAILDKIIFR